MVNVTLLSFECVTYRAFFLIWCKQSYVASSLLKALLEFCSATLFWTLVFYFFLSCSSAHFKSTTTMLSFPFFLALHFTTVSKVIASICLLKQSSLFCDAITSPLPFQSFCTFLKYFFLAAIFRLTLGFHIACVVDGLSYCDKIDFSFTYEIYLFFIIVLMSCFLKMQL